MGRFLWRRTARTFPSWQHYIPPIQLKWQGPQQAFVSHPVPTYPILASSFCEGNSFPHMSTIDLEKCDHLNTPSFTATRSTSVVSEIDKDDQTSLPPSTTTQDDEFPDGGWAAWLTVLGAFLALLCTFGQLTSFGTFQSWYSTHQLQHLPPSTISWIGSLQLWVFFFSVSQLIALQFYSVLTSLARGAQLAASLMLSVPQSS